MRFFNHEIAQDGTLWLDQSQAILSARYTPQGQWPGRWHVVVVEYGDPEKVPVIDGDRP